MRKTYTKLKLALGLLLLAGTGLTANAVDSSSFNNPLPEYTLGSNVSITEKGTGYKYTPSSNETVFVNTNYTNEDLEKIGYKNPYGGPSSVYFFYSDETEYYQQVDPSTLEYKSTGWEFTFDLTGGKTYIIGYPNDGFMEEGFSFTMSLDENEQGITSVTPEPGKAFDYNLYQDIQIRGTGAISDSFGKATFSYGSTVVTLNEGNYAGFVGTNGSPTFLQIGGVSTKFKELMDEAAQNGADSFTVTVEGVQISGVDVTLNNTNNNSVSVQDGKVSVTYPVTPAPKYLSDESTWPKTFYQTWAKDDPAGIATLKFSQDIESVEAVTVISGQVIPNSPGGESTPTQVTVDPSNVTINGSTVTINFTNTSYANISGSQITITVANVLNTEGLAVDFGDPGGSTLFQYLSYSTASAPEPTPGTEYMEKGPELISDVLDLDEMYPAVEILWPETVTIADASLNVTVAFNGGQPQSLSSTYINLEKYEENTPGIARAVENDDEGQKMVLLLGSAGLLQGPGEYTIVIPKGYVKNSEGAVNTDQTLKVTASEADFVEGTLSPASGAKFESGENVKFTITFEGTLVEQEYSEDAPLMVYGGLDYDKQFTWTDNELSLEGNVVTISLGDELEDGNYELVFRSGQLTIDGNPNGEVSAQFTVGDSTSGSLTEYSDPEFDPADNSTISFGSVSLTWEDGIKAIEDPKAYVSYDGGEPVEVEITVYYETDYDPITEVTTVGAAYGALVDFNDLTINEDYSTKGGEYVVTIPAGTFMAYENEVSSNPEYTLTYNLVAYDGDCNITPETEYGKVYAAEELEAVTISWPNYSSFSSVNPDNKSITLYQIVSTAGEGELTESLGAIDSDYITVNADNGTIVLDLSYLEPGSYRVELPSGYVYFNAFTMNGSEEFSYTITDGLSSATVLQPVENVLSMAAPVNLTWNYLEVMPTEEGLAATLKYYDENGDPESVEVSADLFSFFTIPVPDDEEGGVDQGPADIPVPAAAGSGNVLSIDVVDLLEGVTGDVTLSIPAGIVETAGGKANPAQEVMFTIRPLYDVAYTVEYDEDSNTLTFSWNDDTDVSFTAGFEGAAVIEGDDMDNIVLEQYETIDMSDDWTALVVDLSEVDMDGNFTLVIPEGYLTFNYAYINSTISYDFNFTDGVFGEGHNESENPGTEIPGGDTSAVDSLEAEAAQGGIYNLQGVKLNKEVKELNPGLYIINGKKVMVK